MLIEKLEQTGIREALEAIGYDCQELFGDLIPEMDRLYASYDWRKIPCAGKEIRKDYVIHAIPPKELLESGNPWEEWFFQFEQPEHHVLFLEKQLCCSRDIWISEEDKEHPEEACGHTWYYYEDENSFPHFAGKAKLRNS